MVKDGESRNFAKKLQFLIRVLMESGVLYFVVGFAHLVVWFGRDSFAVTFLGTIVSILIPKNTTPRT